jgi:hypothetical protein
MKLWLLLHHKLIILQPGLLFLAPGIIYVDEHLCITCINQSTAVFSPRRFSRRASTWNSLTVKKTRNLVQQNDYFQHIVLEIVLEQNSKENSSKLQRLREVKRENYVINNFGILDTFLT